jgi:hypothetical protein
MTDKQQPKTDPQGDLPGNQSPNTPNFRESDGSEQERRTDPHGNVPGNQSPNTPNIRESDAPEQQRASKDG